jgi:hypothetical protein
MIVPSSVLRWPPSSVFRLTGASRWVAIACSSLLRDHLGGPAAAAARRFVDHYLLVRPGRGGGVV